ncbi:hypothetical protein ACE6H2_011957 [Prunus campanulata]
MAGSVMFQSLCCITPHSPRCYKNQTLAFTHSQFFSSKSFLRLKKQSLVSALQINKRQRTRRYHSVPVVFAALPCCFRLPHQKNWKTGYLLHLSHTKCLVRASSYKRKEINFNKGGGIHCVEEDGGHEWMNELLLA